MKRESRVRKIGTKLALASFFCILITVFLAILTMFLGSSRLVNQIFEEDVGASVGALKSRINEMKTTSLQGARDLAQYPAMVSAVKSGQSDLVFSTMNTVVKELGEGTDFVTVTDSKGNVLARKAADSAGSSVADQKNVQAALNGGSSSFVETGDQVRLSVRSACPITDGGTVIGVISTGYSLEERSLVDALKGMTGSEYSIFLNDENINTTVSQDSKRLTGTKLDAGVADLVLKQKAAYTGETTLLGQPYYIRYEPILDDSGQAVGALFAGKPLSAALAFQRTVTFQTVAISILIALVGILAFLWFSRKKISEPIAKMSSLAEQLALGHLEAKLGVTKSNDEIGRLADSLRSVRQTLRLYVGDISSHLTLMADGDMTARMEQEYIGDFGPIRGSLQTISESLSGILARIRLSAEQVDRGAGQVSSGAQVLARGSADQASSIEELSAAVEDISEKIRQNTENMASITTAVNESVGELGASEDQLGNLLASMQDISESSAQIEKIIKTIDSIAFQTNLLALNASVEAARAGEAGRGFAVVADEVRNLAARSAEASKETARLIHGSLDRIQEGSLLAEKTAESSAAAYEKLQRINDSIRSVNAASGEQAGAVSQITQGVHRVSEVVQTNSATAQQSAAASEELSGQASLLLQEVSRFRLGAEADNA